jgi:large subunit ribosomal protein L19
MQSSMLQRVRPFSAGAVAPARPARRTCVAPSASFSTALVLEEMQKTQLRTNLPKVRIGDTVRLGVAVVEGKKIRTQTVEGVIIAEHGHGARIGCSPPGRGGASGQPHHFARGGPMLAPTTNSPRHRPLPAGSGKTMTFRRTFQGVGIELIIPVNGPTIQSLEVVKSGFVRRAKLYYLRERQGKSAKLREVLKKSTKAKMAAKAAAAKAAAA